MTIELPADAQVLRTEIARASLARSFRQEEEPPDCLISNPREIARAEREWRENYSRQVALLARVSQQALDYLDRKGLESQKRLEAALVAFTSSVATQAELNSFMHANPYLEKLVADTRRDTDLFRSLLTLLVDLGKLGPEAKA